MFVLQVGIGKYQHTPSWAELRGAVTDVVEMRKVLESERWGIPPSNIVTLTDADGTKQRIFEAFKSHLVANAQAHFEKTKNRDAVVMFQFSGHGSQAPDADGDEKDDGKDETLVTVDSQDAPGKNFDITDDEIFALTAELRRWTDNIVYIFDSCHSGSGTRNSEDVRRLPERKSVPVPVAGVGLTTRSGDDKPSDGDSAILPPGDDYIVITAARANELASQKNCFEECGVATQPIVYGNLTFYLIDELKNARSDTSYRELMENVTRRVLAEKPTQTPQIEGNKARFVFGSLGKTEDNFIRIFEAESKKPAGSFVKIRAGAMQGVTVGTIVSFYDKAVSRFDGAEKLGGGTVTAVSPTESTVRVADTKRPIAVDDKSVIISPELGSLRLKVNLDSDAATLTSAQANIIAATRRSLVPGAGAAQRNVNVVTKQAVTTGQWDVAVLKDKFGVVAEKIGRNATCETPGKPPRDAAAVAADGDVFYIAGRDYVPLYRFCIRADAADEPLQASTAKRLEQVLLHLARLKSVQSIANRRSVIYGKVVVKPIRLLPHTSAPAFRCKDGKFIAGSSHPVVPDAKTGRFHFSKGDALWFEVTNNSAYDLYIALLNMKPDGSVELFSPRERDDEMNGILLPKNGGKRILRSDACRVDSKGNFLEAGPVRATLPGLDRFKLIVATGVIRREDLNFLEMGAVRSAGDLALAGRTEWTTVETDLQINDTGN